MRITTQADEIKSLPTNNNTKQQGNKDILFFFLRLFCCKDANDLQSILRPGNDHLLAGQDES